MFLFRDLELNYTRHGQIYLAYSYLTVSRFFN